MVTSTSSDQEQHHTNGSTNSGNNGHNLSHNNLVHNSNYNHSNKRLATVNGRVINSPSLSTIGSNSVTTISGSSGNNGINNPDIITNENDNGTVNNGGRSLRRNPMYLPGKYID